MEPTKQLDPHYSLSCCSSFMSLVINPLPLLSAIQTLILVTDIPMQTLEAKKQDHETKDQNPYLDKGNRSDERDADNVALPNVIAEFSIECCSLIFLVDRLKLRRKYAATYCKLSISPARSFIHHSVGPLQAGYWISMLTA